jgi:hypothetical protein
MAPTTQEGRKTAARRAKSGQRDGASFWRLNKLVRQDARSYDEATEEPSWRHIGDVEGIVTNAQVGASGTCTMYVVVPMHHAMTALEAATSSLQGANLVVRLGIVDPPIDDEDEDDG